MGRFLTTRRSQWFPVVGAAALLAGIGAGLGLAAGPRLLLFYLGVLAGAVVVTGFLRLRRRDAEPDGERQDPAPDPVPGAKGYDLARDDSTDDQRWLM